MEVGRGGGGKNMQLHLNLNILGKETLKWFLTKTTEPRIWKRVMLDYLGDFENP